MRGAACSPASCSLGVLSAEGVLAQFEEAGAGGGARGSDCVASSSSSGSSRLDRSYSCSYSNTEGLGPFYSKGSAWGQGGAGLGFTSQCPLPQPDFFPHPQGPSPKRGWGSAWLP